MPGEVLQTSQGMCILNAICKKHVLTMNVMLYFTFTGGQSPMEIVSQFRSMWKNTELIQNFHQCSVNLIAIKQLYDLEMVFIILKDALPL